MGSNNEYEHQSQWITSEVKCDLCSYEWIAVRPSNTKTLECPNCNNNTKYFINKIKEE